MLALKHNCVGEFTQKRLHEEKATVAIIIDDEKTKLARKRHEATTR
jgi:hypothetical protein